MSDFVILTDSTTDLPLSYYEEHDVRYICLSCIMDGVTYDKENVIDINDFYNSLRNGSLPTTSQVNPDIIINEVKEIAKECKNILYIAFSSGLSGTYQSGVIARDDLKETNPEINLCVIDSLCASLGEGLLVHKAVCMRDEGKSFEETCKYVEDNRLNVAHIFTIDDLFHLCRGGRVSKTTAVLGSMINIKPILHVDNEGKLINIAKARGRKKALTQLVDKMEELKDPDINKNDIIFISHSDCLDDAKYVADEIKNRFGIDSFLIDYIGPVIGSHTGTGTVALFFMATNRG